eukprot:NODE_6_length_70510_cov_1.054395.p29 type:complete len:293 gc:universal NODE_6_length_70510_cov_1.054395:28566-27688(-)
MPSGKRQSLLGDAQLVKNIFSGKTKEPITRENWLTFVESTYTSENTILYFEFCKFNEVYHRECQKIGLNPQLSADDILIVNQLSSMQDFHSEVKDENGLKLWCEDICRNIIDKYIKIGSSLEVNISSKVRDECLDLYKKGRFHPGIFKDVQKAILDNILQNDLPKFKQLALDQNILVQHRRLRAIFCLIFLGLATIFYGLIIGFKVSQYYRLFGFPFLYIIFICYFQWKAKFCVYFADKKQKNTKGYEGLATVEDEYACQYQGKRSSKIKKQATAATLFCFIVLFVVPPYNW